MKLNKLVDKAKQTIEKRGGMENLKADAQELKEAAKGEGSLKDKAKAAAKALKEPGRAAAEPTDTKPDPPASA
ncbi:MAG TPA: hypothetical protein VF731_03915 [Solirubrobacterales bacterium]